jgi:hypothetical protein
MVLALQFPLQLITADQLHGIFHRSISSSFGFEHEYVADGGVWYSYEVANQWTILVRRLVLATSTAYGSNSPHWTLASTLIHVRPCRDEEALVKL